MEFILVNEKRETILGGYTRFSENQSLINDANIIILDIGSTCDLTSSHEVIINTKSAGAEYTISSANRE